MQILNCCFIDNIKNFDFFTVVSFIAAITALLTSIYSVYHSRKTTYINAVTTSRLKYIENLRSYISEFCGLLLHTSNTKLEENEIKKISERTDVLRFTIKLHLNRKNYFDKELINQIDSISNFPATIGLGERINEITQLTNYAQDIFALEWAGIKLEATGGKLWDYQVNRLTKRHKKEYGNEN
jgi:hypothetical protein